MHVLVEGARPRTLPAAVAPVLVGTALAASPHALRAGLALLTALALQVAVNYANDYFDGVGGIDTEERTGPRRMVASGLVEPSKMKHAIAGALLVAAVSGAVLAAMAGWQLLLVGAVAMLAALGYSGGSKPYASMGLGELFVFVFFGLVATAGTTYVQDERLAVAPVIAGIAMGALATALLVVNNLRDIPTDEATGKRTLAVRMGERDTRRLFTALVATAFGSLAALVVVTGAVFILVAALSLVLLVPAARMVRHAPLGPQLVDALERTAKGQLVFGVLLAAGLLLDRAVA
ncbi:MAG: 1,4-dihydroxy-2-naphthoate octaprenyltransferase [Myxococcota bacterium]|jgi:1,4-dihydroxy-2-naphthoate octaprenyltransferase